MAGSLRFLLQTRSSQHYFSWCLSSSSDKNSNRWLFHICLPPFSKLTVCAFSKKREPPGSIFSYFHTFTLSYFHTFILPHFHTFILPYFHTFILCQLTAFAFSKRREPPGCTSSTVTCLRTMRSWNPTPSFASGSHTFYFSSWKVLTISKIQKKWW